MTIGGPEVRAITFLQTDAMWKGMLYSWKVGLWCGRGTQYRGPSSCPLSSLLRATNPCLSSHSLHFLSPLEQGEWLWTGFCTLALKEHTCVCSRLPSYPGKKNLHWFSWPDVIWVPLPCSAAVENKLIVSRGEGVWGIGEGVKKCTLLASKWSWGFSVQHRGYSQ